MERKLVLAITLSLLVLISWSALVSKQQTFVNKEVTQITSPVAPVATPPPRQSPQTTAPEEVSVVPYSYRQTELLFNESDAAIQEVVFHQYQGYTFELKNGLMLADPKLNFRKFSFSLDSAAFIHEDADKRIIKRFLFSKHNYFIELELQIENLSGSPINIDMPLLLGTLQFSGDAQEARFKDVTIASQGKITHPNARKDIASANVSFMGLRDRYFCLIIEPKPNTCSGFIRKLNAVESEVGLQIQEQTLNPNNTQLLNFRIYLGPQELSAISAINPEWTAVLYYGTFNFFSQILLQLLYFLQGIVHNWGVAVILLSISIYLLLFPLSLKQIRSMKEMQRIQPLVEELRKKYKDNPQKLNTEIMSLYRQHKVNPFGGCLPMILQIPVFFALYQALIRSVALKGATFLWIKDLSAPDRLFILPSSLPIIGNEINIIPILMMIVMFVQQKVSTVASTGSQAEQQRIMLIIFPLMFGIIFYRMPSGLVLYWFVNSLLMVLQQVRLHRKGQDGKKIKH